MGPTMLRLLLLAVFCSSYVYGNKIPYRFVSKELARL